jgi:hypothetical protein
MPEPANAIDAVSAARARSEQNTAAIPSACRRRPNSAACSRPNGESRPGSQPVAMPRSLSSLIEWVSKTICVGTVGVDSLAHQRLDLVDGPVQILLADDKGRREPDRGAVGVLGKHASLRQPLAGFPAR